jgi:dienelactone hydrolase
MKPRAMKRLLVALLLGAPALAFAATDVAWVPENLPPPPPAGTGLGGYLKPEQGQAVLDAALARFPDRAAWDAYKQHALQRMQEGAGLAPWPKRTPLNAVIRNRREYDGYSVENVAFESMPGLYVTGSLYRPLNVTGPMPVILNTHGHSAIVVKPEDYEKHARFSASVQQRAGTLARMGALAFVIDMFANGDGIQLFGLAAHRQPLAGTIQIWNATRAIDFLLSLEGADPQRVAVTGESGGGTQAFLLTALDPRITVSVPVVMVSSYFFGGCPCESGQPIHRSADHFVSNAIIASFAAPRPMLVVSDGADWTQHVPEIEFPFLQKVYGYYGAQANVVNVHLPSERHDYGPSKRDAMYHFMAKQLRLNVAAATDAQGKLDESHVTVEPPAKLHVFDAEFPIPANALHDAAAIERKLHELQK